MKKKQVFLHIGYDKTGTSAIQGFLYRNRKILAGQGILYPEAAIPYPAYRNHTVLVLAMRMASRSKQGHGEGMVLNRFRDLDKGRTCPEHLWKNLIEEIDASPCERVCISSEAFVNFAKDSTSAQLIRKTAGYLSPHDVSVIIYLRRQDDYLESFYNQVVKKGRVIRGHPFSFWRDMNPLRGNYGQALDAWSEVFGADRMIVRKYSKEAFGPGGVIPDFLRVIGADENTVWTSKGKARANPRLPNSMIELKRRLNRLGYGYFANELVNRAIRRTAAKRKSSKKVRLLSPEQRRKLLLEFEPVNNRIAREYFPGEGPLYSPDEVGDDPWIEPRLRFRDVAAFVPNLAVVTARYYGRKRRRKKKAD